MKLLQEESYFYSLERDEETGEYFLEVVCGTVAIFTIRIKLTKKEIAEFNKNPESVRVLANRIVYSPRSYLHRRV